MFNKKVLILLSLAICQLVHLGQAQPSGDTTAKVGEKKFNVGKLFCGLFSCGDDNDGCKTQPECFKKIDKYLLQNVVDNDDAEINMEAAINWLKILDPQDNVVGSLQTLTELSTVQPYVCDRTSYSVVSENNRLVSATKLSSENSRVANIVQQYSIKHARDCFKKYTTNMETSIKGLDAKVIERVEAITNAFLKPRIHKALSSGSENDGTYEGVDMSVEHFFQSKPSAFGVNFILNIGREEEDDNLVYLALKRLASDDPNWADVPVWVDYKKPIDLELTGKLWGLFNEFLFNSCQAYNWKLGPDVFIPAMFDTKFLQDEDYDGTDPNFLIAFSRYRFCAFMNKEKYFWIKDPIIHGRKMP